MDNSSSQNPNRKASAAWTIHGSSSSYIVYSLLFCLIAMCIFRPFWTRGISLVSLGDGYDQYYATLAYIGYYGREFLSCLTQGTIRQFDFAIGLGDDVVGTLSYYGFGDPLNWLAIFVAPEDTVYLYSFLMILRWYLGGLAFIWYALRRKMSPLGAVSGAMAYSFCPYLLYYNMLFAAGYGNVMYLLPMAFGGIDDLLERKEKRFSLLLSVSIGLQALCGYYFLYMESIILVIYFLVRFCCLPKEQKVLPAKTDVSGDSLRAAHGDALYRDGATGHPVGRYCAVKICCCILSYLAGIMAGAIILLPSIGHFLQSSRTGSVSFALTSLLEQYDLSYFRTALEELFLPSADNVFGFPVLLLPAVVIFFRKSERFRDAKWLLMIALVMYCSKTVSYVMSAFAYSDRRWTFFLFFASSLVIAAAADRLQELSLREIGCIAGFYVLWAACCCVRLNLADGIGKRVLLWRYGVPFLLLLAVLAVSRLAGRQRSNDLRGHVLLMQAVLLAVMAGNLIYSGIQWTGTTPAGGSTRYWRFYTYAELRDNYELSAADVSEDAENEEGIFYRVDAWDAGKNGGLLYHANTTNEYFSVMNSSVEEFWNRLNISGGLRGSYSFNGLDTRLDLEALLSVRYSRIYQGGNRVGERSVVEDFLPLGIFYSVSEVMLESDAEEIASVDLGGVLLQKLILEDDTVPDTDDVGETATEEDDAGDATDYEVYPRTSVAYTVEIVNAAWNADGVTMQADAGAQILLFPEWDDDLLADLTDDSDYTGIVYVQMEGFLYDGTVSLVTVNGNEISTKAEQDFLVQVEIADPSEPIVIELPEAGTYTVGEIGIIVQDMSLLPEQVILRGENVLTQTAVDVNIVRGTIETAEDGWVFFSIPYLGAWHAYVDGVETVIAVADYSFIAVPVTAGTHEIVLKYHNPWFAAGWWLTVTGMVLLSMAAFFRRRRRSRGRGLTGDIGIDI